MPTPTPSVQARKLAVLVSELQDFSDTHRRFHEKLSSIAQASTDADADPNADPVEAEEDGLADVAGLPAVVPSVEQGVNEVLKMVGVLEQLRDAL